MTNEIGSGKNYPIPNLVERSSNLSNKKTGNLMVQVLIV